MKIGDIIKVEVSNISLSISKYGPNSVVERDLAGLQYAGAYIMHKMHNNVRNRKNWRDIEFQQATIAVSPVKIRS